jgi:hypothetical protein
MTGMLLHVAEGYRTTDAKCDWSLRVGHTAEQSIREDNMRVITG